MILPVREGLIVDPSTLEYDTRRLPVDAPEMRRVVDPPESLLADPEESLPLPEEYVV
jgi:hypothetical protein